MDFAEPSARPLLSVNNDTTNDRLGSPLQEISLPSTPASTTSSYVLKPLKAKPEAQRPSRIRRSYSKFIDVLHRITRAIASSWKACVCTGRVLWRKSWTSETCSYIIATLALAGLVATLLVHQNKPLPQWPQLVTINSIISLYSLLMRACVGVVLAEGISQSKWNWYHKPQRLDHMNQIDSASRGSWGAVTLHFYFRPKSAYYLAAFGAVITIMASLTGFFSQQLVQFKDCYEKDVTAVVSLTKSNEYSRSGGSFQNMSPVEYAPMVAAINVGIIQPVTDLTNVLSSGCDSGNCSFPNTDGAAFSTLAMTHVCEDSTAHIRTLNGSADMNAENWPVGYLAYDYSDGMSVEWPRERGGLVLKTWFDDQSLYFIYRSSWQNNYDWKATNCSLFPTINTYGASIKANKLEETLKDVIPLLGLRAQFRQPPVIDSDQESQLFWWTYRMTTNYTIRNGIRESCEGSEKSAPDHVKFMKATEHPTYLNSTGHVVESVGWRWWYYPRDCIWSIHGRSITTIAAKLATIFQGQEAIMGLIGGVEASAHLRQLYLDGNMTFDTVNERIGALATSMTAVIRSHGGDGSQTFPQSTKGDVWVKTTCIIIRWPWITFPAVMVGLSGVFLLLVVIENRGIDQDRLWKSSFLAALFCEVDMPSRPMGKAEMKANAKSTSVRLGGKHNGSLRLIAH